MKMIIGKQTAQDAVTLVSEEVIKKSRAKAVIGEETLSQEMEEIKSKRGRRSKLYSDGKNRMRAEFYEKAIHILNCEKNEYEDIDLRFKDDGEILTPKTNCFQSKFYKNLNNGKIFEMEKDLCKIGLKSLDIVKRGNGEVKVCDCSEGNCECGKVKIEDAFQGTDIEYVVDSEGIKENIIVKETSDKYEYDFCISLDNLAVGISEDGKSIELTKKDSGMKEFIIPSPVMYDAAGENSDEVYYEIEEYDSEKLSLKVVASKEWINDEKRVFPVTVDPQIKTVNYQGYYYDDDYYDGGIFEYKIFNGGTEQTGNPRLYYSTTTNKNIYTTITVYKNKLPKYLQDNYTKVLLKMKAPSSSKINGFMIGYDCFDSYKSEFSADVTAFFNEDKETAVIPMINYYNFTELRENDITFNPPCLVVEYENKIVSIALVSQPETTDYIPGDNFSTEGMRIQATYEDGSKRFLSQNEYNYYPAGALIKSDEKVIVSCVENPEIVCNVDIVVDNNEFYFSDRRAKEDQVGYYTMQNLDENGNLRQGEVVKLTLNDGASQEDEGTPLNAANLNKIIKQLIENGVLKSKGGSV